jgi:hypothetical protein
MPPSIIFSTAAARTDILSAKAELFKRAIEPLA